MARLTPPGARITEPSKSMSCIVPSLSSSSVTNSLPSASRTLSSKPRRFFASPFGSSPFLAMLPNKSISVSLTSSSNTIESIAAPALSIESLKSFRAFSSSALNPPRPLSMMLESLSSTAFNSLDVMWIWLSGFSELERIPPERERIPRSSFIFLAIYSLTSA